MVDIKFAWCHGHNIAIKSGPDFCLLLGLSSNYTQPITDKVTEETCLSLAEHSLSLLRVRDRKRAQINIIDPYAMATQGARLSVGMVLTVLDKQVLHEK